MAKSSKVHSYQIDLVPVDEGGYTVVVPALPGCISFGETPKKQRATPEKRSNCIWRIWRRTKIDGGEGLEIAFRDRVHSPWSIGSHRDVLI